MPASTQSTDRSAVLDPVPAVSGTGPPVQNVFEPPNSFAVIAIGRNKGLVAVCAVVLAMLGVGLGLLQQQTYTASATLQVGQVNPNSPGFLGYVQSSSSLADAFSRAIAAEPVLETIERRLEIGRAKATSELSAEPIPLSPVFRVIATGSTASDAMRLANVAAGAVVAYEEQSNSSSPESRALLHDFREASLALRQTEVDVEAAGESTDALLQAEAERSAAQIKLKAIAGAYVANVTSQAPRSGLISLLAGATSAASDKRSQIQLYGFLGLLIGIVVGCGAAVLRERRRLRNQRQGEGTGPSGAHGEPEPA